MARRSGLFLCAAAVIAATATLVGIACVPDLKTFALPVQDASNVPSCGDGIIDFSAGEQCDPGASGTIGCTSKCRIECPDGGFVDDASNHCYFVLAQSVSYGNAKQGCDLQNAHVLTFASREELDRVSAWSNAQDAAAWVGLEVLSAQGWVSVISEPGWSRACTGCYAEVDDGGFARCGLEAGTPTPPCVTADGRNPAPWCAASCGDKNHAICEREPPGAAAQPCNGGTCVDLPRTLGRKRYLYIATSDPPAIADAFCRQLPKGTLVVFESREEREQLAAALKALDVTDGVWIGLSRPSVDAGPSEWTWDDGTRASDATYPPPWGETPLPSIAQGATLRAYIEIFGPGVAVDSELARNIDRNRPGGTPSKLPYVCQFAP